MLKMMVVASANKQKRYNWGLIDITVGRLAHPFGFFQIAS